MCVILARIQIAEKSFDLGQSHLYSAMYGLMTRKIAAAGRVRGAQLQNSNGVILDVKGAQVGFEASLSLSNTTVELE